nr:MAG TPA: 30S ribosomal protein S2 [Caudoviricetes sp.]
MVRYSFMKSPHIHKNSYNAIIQNILTKTKKGGIKCTRSLSNS